MSEILVYFCDFCNTFMNTHPRNGRGFCELSEADAIDNFDRKRMPDGIKVMCLDCQDEVTKEL